jgi:hypothetical protein
MESLQRLGAGGIQPTIRQQWLASMALPIRAPVEIGTGQSLYTGRPYRSAGEMVANLTPFSRFYNTYTSITKTFAQKGALDAILKLTTGIVRVTTEDRAEIMRRVATFLAERAAAGDVGTANRFFATGATPPDLANLMKSYYRERQAKGHGKVKNSSKILQMAGGVATATASG